MNKPREPEGGAQPPGRVLPDEQAAGARGGRTVCVCREPRGRQPSLVLIFKCICVYVSVYVRSCL